MFALRSAPKARTVLPLARAYGGGGGGGYSSSYNRGERSSDGYNSRSDRGDGYSRNRSEGYSGGRGGAGGFQQRSQFQNKRSDGAGARPDRREALFRLNKDVATKRATQPAPHFLTLGDLSVAEISQLVRSALEFKLVHKHFGPSSHKHLLAHRSVAMIFSKRSTRTRVATETSVAALGGHSFFLGKDDIQLGVNETLEDSAKVISSMVDGIMARVNSHDEVATFAKHSPVPVINALCDLYHPTQILADLLTMVETYLPNELPVEEITSEDGNAWWNVRKMIEAQVDLEAMFQGKKMAWVGDQNNITNELMLTLPRFGVEMGIAAPKGYDVVDPRVAARIEEQGTGSLIKHTNSPAEALADADLVVTDTWISMGQEEETAKRLSAFAGYQITDEMVTGAGAKPDWKFMHCLPRHKEEVDDGVFYGERSLVFPEAENRKWTIMAVMDAMVGRWSSA